MLMEFFFVVYLLFSPFGIKVSRIFMTFGKIFLNFLHDRDFCIYVKVMVCKVKKIIQPGIVIWMESVLFWVFFFSFKSPNVFFFFFHFWCYDLEIYYWFLQRSRMWEFEFVKIENFLNNSFTNESLVTLKVIFLFENNFEQFFFFMLKLSL